MEPISNILFTLYRGTPHHEEWVLVCLQGAWRGMVGHTVAEASRPIVFERACLKIEVPDEVWLQTLQDMKEILLDKIRSGTGGEVREIRFVAAQR